MLKCEFVGADALVPDELRLCYALFDMCWVKAFVMEVSSSISGLCIYTSVYVIIGRGAPNGFSVCSVSELRATVVEVKPSEPPHVLILLLGVGKDMLPVKYLCSNKASFCDR